MPTTPTMQSFRGSILFVRDVALRHLGLALLLSACASAPPQIDPNRYRLAGSGDHWDVSGMDRVFDDLEPRYPEFFAIILDPEKTRVPDLRAVRNDLEHQPVDRRNFDALNAVAIAYFETNYRAESWRGSGFSYLALSQRSAQLAAVPWRAYGETEHARLRDAILDFFEDAGTGGKLHTDATAPRLARIVSSLERKETEPGRLARIRSLSRRLEHRTGMATEEAPGP